jgi:DNA-binding response OmpR family regulator
MPNGRRVLVVEDDVSIGQVIADLLADEGYQVRWAKDGRAALAVLDEWRPDVIVLDLMMPVLDGRAFRAEQRRRGGAVAQVPVIVLSGARAARAAAAELGVAAVLTKPFDLDRLVATVGRVLEQAPT